jgi:hypothetical protein
MFLSALVTVCGGFLFAVLWMDLMFDVQILRHRNAEPLPEDVLASIATYYRRVTTSARPMSSLIGVWMIVGLVAIVVQLVRGDLPRWVSLASLALVVPPTALAAVRVLPSAVRLGSRTGSLADQSLLARQICRDHLQCLAWILAFLALRLWVALA